MAIENETPLEPQLAAGRERLASNAPTAVVVLKRDNARLIEEGLLEKALQMGQKAPEFSLPDATGKTVQLSELLSEGPVVLTFYRGEWCPYCNLTLRAYQDTLAGIKWLGTQLVAISLQTPDHSISMAEKNNLEFKVLSDAGGRLSGTMAFYFRSVLKCSNF